MHHLERLIGILFADTDKDQIVENAFRRQGHVHYLREIHFEYRQENPDTGIADVVILHGWNADDRCRIDCVTPMCNRGQMKNRIIFDCGVITGVIAKGALRAHFTGLNVTFQDKIDIGWYIDVDRFAADELD